MSNEFWNDVKLGFIHPGTLTSFGVDPLGAK
jgi:hypothetical protein